MAAIDRRVGLLFLGFMVLLGLALMRATYLGAFKADSLQEAASHQQIVQTQIPATRGVITDRDGVQLAISESAADVIADPFLITRKLAAAQKLAPVLHQPMLTLLAHLSRHTGYMPLARQISTAQAKRVAALKIDGITTTPDTKRIYPRSWAASQVLGGVHADGGGAAAWSTTTTLS